MLQQFVSPKISLVEIFLSVTSCEAISMSCASSSDFRQRRIFSTLNFHPLNWFLQALHSSRRGILGSCSYTGVHSPQMLLGRSRDPSCSISTVEGAAETASQRFVEVTQLLGWASLPLLLPGDLVLAPAQPGCINQVVSSRFLDSALTVQGWAFSFDLAHHSPDLQLLGLSPVYRLCC